MFKLLGAYFSRLSKWTIFRVLFILMLIGGIGAALLLRTLPVQGAWNLPYMLAFLMFPHYVGIVIGLFNYPLFTNGTIRNQLSVGHRRSHIYLADWAASNAFAVALFLAFSVTFFVTFSFCTDPVKAGQGASMMEGFPGMASAPASETVVSGKAIVCGMLIAVMQIIFYTTVTQLFCVVLKGVKSFLAIYLGNQAIILIGIGYASLTTDHDLPEKLLNLFPTVVCMRQSSFAVDPDFWPGMLAMIAETVIVFVIGMLYFRKTDIN